MATTDVLTEGEALAALPGIGGGKEAEILIYNSAVSEALDRLCGPIVQRPVTEIHDGGTSIVLDHTPVGALTSVAERVGLTSTAIDIDTLASSGRVIERPYSRFAAGARSLTVTYTAGRYATTEDVSATFKLAARLWLQSIWRPAEGGGSETFGPDLGALSATPDDVLAILGIELRAPVVA